MSYIGSKICPQCGTVCTIDRPTCSSCGHQYRTKFPDPPLQQTIGFPGVPLPGPQPPPGVNPQNIINAPNVVQLKPGEYACYPGNHPWLAAFFCHMFAPGAGAIYNRQWWKAGLTLVVTMVLLFFSWWFSLFFHLVMLVDCCMVAYRLDKGKVIDQWSWFNL